MARADPPGLIVFDIGNVLLRFSVARAKRNFDRVEPGSGARIVRRVWNHPWGRAFETGGMTGRGLFDRVRREAGLRMGYADFRRALEDIFTPLPANIALLRRLSRRFPTALLSNINPIHWRYIRRRYPALWEARWRFGSHRLGMMKPDPRLYRAVAQKTGVPLHRLAYVDDIPAFVRTARALGMRAARYDGRRPLAAVLRGLGVK